MSKGKWNIWAKGINQHLEEEKDVIKDVDSGMDKANSLVKSSLGKLDEMISSASGNMWVYVVMFTILLVGLAYKLLKWSFVLRLLISS